MANILNKKKLISLENYVFFFTKKPEKTYAYTWYSYISQIYLKNIQLFLVYFMIQQTKKGQFCIKIDENLISMTTTQ